MRRWLRPARFSAVTLVGALVIGIVAGVLAGGQPDRYNAVSQVAAVDSSTRGPLTDFESVPIPIDPEALLTIDLEEAAAEVVADLGEGGLDVAISPNSDTRTVEIQATADDPETAAEVANRVVEHLATTRRNEIQSDYQELTSALQNRVAELEDSIAATEEEIATAEMNLADAALQAATSTNPATVAQASATEVIARESLGRLSGDRALLVGERRQLVSLVADYTTDSQIQSLGFRRVSEAIAPTQPATPATWEVGILVALAVVVAAFLVRFVLTNRLASPIEVRRVTKDPGDEAGPIDRS